MIPVADIAQRVKPRVGSLWSSQAFDDPTFVAALNDSLKDLAMAFVFPANEKLVTLAVSTTSGVAVETAIDENIQTFWVKKDDVDISEDLLFTKKEFYRQDEKKGVSVGFDKFICAESGTYEIYGNFFPTPFTTLVGAMIDLPYSMCLGYLVERCVYYYLTFNLKLTQAATVDATCSRMIDRMGATAFDRTPEKKTQTSSILA
jgi:hypothetical protein